jgi:NADPH-dependent glutamate synthase beta subunit-like oxidoreductase/NAD-dependent dihydropyrimidine dehydrogenase PreA subunit
MQVSRKDFAVPRCTAACPAGVDVPRYIRAVRDGRYGEAVSVLRERLPLPTVCADACFAPCEDVCAYKQFGDPIAIRALKRAAVDKGDDSWLKRKKTAARTGRKVGIIGAGPAGLSAAYYLASLGHHVTMVDIFPEPGGTMRYGIPRYRLPAERLEKDIRTILDLGVVFRGNVSIGRDLTFAEFRSEYDAVFVSTGANSSVKIPLEGAEKEGVLWGWEFLRDIALGKKVAIGQKIAIIGGGNAAVDVALTAKRLGAKRIDLFTRKKLEEMLAHPRELALAEEEGIFINTEWAPKKIYGSEKVTGLGMIRCHSAFDKACNFNPIYDEEITHKIEVENVILAAGQEPVLDFLRTGDEQVNVTRNRVEACMDDLCTSLPGVFAGGDIVTGPATIIGAVAHGRQAAESIDKYLGGSGDISEILAEPEEAVDLDDFAASVENPKNRSELGRLKVWERTLGFDQVELPMSDAQIKAEASRCLSCDARKFEVKLAVENCKECGYCVEVCGVGTFGPSTLFNRRGYKPMEVKTSEHCVGCYRCFFSCPDFAIDVREKTS